MIRVAICDDEDIIRNKTTNILNSLFNKFTNDFSIISYSNGELLLKEHEEDNFNIIFLDIDMPKISGFDIAKRIRETNTKVYIIFITSHEELVYKSFDFQPFHFLRKQSEENLIEDLNILVLKLMKIFKSYKTIILSTSDNQYVTSLNNIVYLESEKHYINYYLKNGDVIKVRGKLVEDEYDLIENDFIQIHKSYIVNLGLISKIDNKNNELLINGSIYLPISRKYKKELEESYLNYLQMIL